MYVYLVTHFYLNSKTHIVQILKKKKLHLHMQFGKTCFLDINQYAVSFSEVELLKPQVL